MTGPSDLLYGNRRRAIARSRPRRPQAPSPTPPQRSAAARLRAEDLLRVLNDPHIGPLPPGRIPSIAEKQFQLQAVDSGGRRAGSSDWPRDYQLYPSAERVESEGNALVGVLSQTEPCGYSLLDPDDEER